MTQQIEQIDTDRDGALLKLLARDPLAEAEQSFGVDHWSQFDSAQQGMSLLLAMDLNKKKSDALGAADDTQFSNPLDRYCRIVSEEGFSLVYREPFTCDGKRDSLNVFWHPDGILLEFDTYGGDRVNSGHLYYNWKPKNPEEWRTCGSVLSSGGWRSKSRDAAMSDWVWAGYHDCREALRLRLRELRRLGTFVSPWQYDPMFNLWHYGDTHGINCDLKQLERLKGLTAKRVSMLPKHVQESVLPGLGDIQ
jgi:hypothetical protein